MGFLAGPAIGAILVAGLLLMLPRLLSELRERASTAGRRMPLSKLLRVRAASTIDLVVVDCAMRVAHGTSVATAGLMSYGVTHRGGSVSFEAPPGVVLRTGDTVVLELDRRGRIIRVRNDATGQRWEIPRVVLGTEHPLAPIATMVACVLAPVVFLIVFATLVLSKFDSMTHWLVSMHMAEKGSELHTADQFSSPYVGTIHVMFAVTLGLSFVLGRRTRHLVPPCRVVTNAGAVHG